MRIGELAGLAGLAPATIRYYERRGLLPRPGRTASGYRSYSPETGLQLRLIRWAKGSGFTLREIRELLQVVEEHAHKPSDRVRSRFDAKLGQIEQRMRQLASIRDELRALAAFHQAAEWATLERRCCPFIHFTLEWKRDDSIWITFTGGPGVKEALVAEIVGDRPVTAPAR
jgi:DNA-binding transcriptional MerR regulator